MKKLILSLLVLGMFSACGDDNDCTPSDWVGVYSGEITCDIDPVPQSSSVTIELGTAENEIVMIDADGVRTSFIVDDCSLSESEDGVTSSLTLNGNNLTVRSEGEIFGISFDCSGNFTK